MKVMVKKVIPQNMIINQDAAEVDNHIPWDDIFAITLNECNIYILSQSSNAMHKGPEFYTNNCSHAVYFGKIAPTNPEESLSNREYVVWSMVI